MCLFSLLKFFAVYFELIDDIPFVSVFAAYSSRVLYSFLMMVMMMMMMMMMTLFHEGST